MNPPLLSLVTGTLNRPRDFKRLLDSVIMHTSVDWELVVADASDHPYGCTLPPQVTVLPERPRLGCSKGYNRAFTAAAKGIWVIWLNDDCEVTAGYDTAAIAFMEKHPEIGLGALHYSEHGGPFHVNSAWGAIYANFGILRRDIGNQVGWFDEDIWMYGCDNSLTLRVLLAGYGVADIPDARIVHHSTKDILRHNNQQYRLQDNLTLTRKYMSYRQQWLATFQKHQISSGYEAWSHGSPARLANPF